MTASAADRGADRDASGAPAAARPSATVRSVERCIDIIDVLATSRGALSLSAISRAIDTPKSTTLTIVRTLVQRGLLAMDPGTKLYQIGLGFGRYASERSRRVDLVELAAPFLQALARDTLETSTLAMREVDKVYNVCRFVAPQPLQLVVPIGIARDLHATAAGKLFLAWMGDAERRTFMASHTLARHTPRTLTAPAALGRRLAACRREGYALARGETSADLFGVAAPIFGGSGAIVAAVNLSGPLFRLKPNHARYIRSTCEAAAAISREILRVGGDVALPPAATPRDAGVKAGPTGS